VPESRQRIVEFLEGRAKELGSRYLSLAASHVASDPFAKVKQMVKDLIVKLMEEANSEADHNSYCTTELATNKLTRENKQSEVDELTANIEKKTAEGQQLANLLAKLSEEVADLKQQQAEAVDLRSVEKKTNMATIADAKEAQIAVEKATKILKDFFAQAADSSLLQSNGEAQLNQEMSQASSAPYSGQQSSSTGILGFLDVILSDFARLESETSSAEDQAQEVHNKFMAETDQDLAVKETEIKHKTNSKADCDQTVARLTSTLKLTQEELDASNNYYQKLKPSCVDNGLSYEERVQKRQEEIQSLQEAMKILSQEDLA
jgi:succinate dehydrogenase flavin-adding protein (antitoxin of CptAB toxin-antitoxin module)